MWLLALRPKLATPSALPMVKRFDSMGVPEGAKHFKVIDDPGACRCWGGCGGGEEGETERAREKKMWDSEEASDVFHSSEHGN